MTDFPEPLTSVDADRTARGIEDVTTEDAFWQTLEADPSDRVTRLIFADWLAQEGRAMEANGQRWQARNGQWPCWSVVTGGSWDWWKSVGGIPECDFAFDRIHAVLPADVWVSLANWTWQGGLHYVEYPTLRAAETALAQALHVLEL